MDPITVLGLAASIIQLIDATVKVTQYINDVKDAPAERSKLAMEVANLVPLLTSLRYRIEGASSDDSWFLGVRSLGAPKGPLDLFKQDLKYLASKLEPQHGAKKIGKLLVWTLDKKDIKNSLDSIERIKSLISLALQRDTFDLSLAIKNDLGKVGLDVQVLGKDFASLRTESISRIDREILDWLSPLSFYAKQKDTLDKVQKGTGGWLLQSVEFTQWLTSPKKQTLWCPGMPGAGKTFMASFIIDHLDKSFFGQDTGIAYLYCGYKQPSHTTQNLIASLIHQLVPCRTVSMKVLRNLQDDHNRLRTRPSVSELLSLLKEAMHAFAQTFIIVDALDEHVEDDGEEGQSREKLLEAINELRSDARVLVTSRWVPDIETELEGSLRMEVRAHDDDIAKYIDSRIAKMKRLQKICREDPTLHDKISSTLIEKSAGMFLLARMYMDSLANKPRQALLPALKALPTKLNGMYDDAMDKINQQDEESVKIAHYVLSWITLVTRPLTVKELQCALAIEYGYSPNEESTIDEELLLSSCLGLVAVDQAKSHLHLIHYSTQEYFESAQQKLFPEAQYCIALTCLMYVSSVKIPRDFDMKIEFVEGFLQQYPLLAYAGKNWGVHARGFESSTNKPFFDSPMDDETLLVCNFVMQWSDNGRIVSYDEACMWGGIHFAAWFGLGLSIEALVKNGIQIDVETDLGCTPLFIAAVSGFKGVVLQLLKFGASVDAYGDYYGTPLLIALRKGDLDMVRLLVENGADLEGSNRISEMALLYLAMKADQNEIFDVLLAHRKEKALSRTLHPAASFRDESSIGRILKLLELGADIHERDSKGKTPLYYAVESENLDVARIFIEKGAHVNDYEEDLATSTPLLAAIASGNADMVKLLLENGADFRSQYQRPAKAEFFLDATNSGHHDSLRFLLELGLDPSIAEKMGRPDLYDVAASERGYIIQSLLEEDVDMGDFLDEFERSDTQKDLRTQFPCIVATSPSSAGYERRIGPAKYREMPILEAL